MRPLHALPSADHLSYAQACAPSGGVSFGELSGGLPFDMMRFRAVFPDRWRGFLRAHFQNPVHVAYFYSIDEKTARNWWEGLSGPSGAFVVATFKAFPAAAALLWSDAA